MGKQEIENRGKMNEYLNSERVEYEKMHIQPHSGLPKIALFPDFQSRLFIFNASSVFKPIIRIINFSLFTKKKLLYNFFLFPIVCHFFGAFNDGDTDDIGDNASAFVGFFFFGFNISSHFYEIPFDSWK